MLSGIHRWGLFLKEDAIYHECNIQQYHNWYCMLGGGLYTAEHTSNGIFTHKVPPPPLAHDWRLCVGNQAWQRSALRRANVSSSYSASLFELVLILDFQKDS